MSSTFAFRSKFAFSSALHRFSKFCAWVVAFSRSMMSTSTSDCSRDFCFSSDEHLVSSASSCSSYSAIFACSLRLCGS